MLLMLDTRSKYHQYYLMEANILSFKNISSIAPPRPTGTLTHSFQKRFKELFGQNEETIESEDVSLPYLEDKIGMGNVSNRYMASNINHLSKVFTVAKPSSTSILSLANEWTYSLPQSYINMFIFEEQKYSLNKKDLTKAVWRSCFNSKINGSFEAIDYNEHEDLLAGSFYLPLKRERILRLYDNKKCHSRKPTYNSAFLEQFCPDNENSSRICKDFTSINGIPSLPSSESFLSQEIPIVNNSRVLNIAVTENLVAYTLDRAKQHIYWAYQNPDKEWVNQTIEYPKELQKFRVAQNFGLKFIGKSSKNESQLLVINLVEENSVVYLKYYVFKFISGAFLSKQEDFIKQHYINITQDEIVENKVYVSSMNTLFKIGVEDEMNSIDIFNLQNLPSSIIKYNPRTKQTLVVNFQKYILLICTKEEDTFVAYSIKDFEDQTFQIKNFDISPNGLYYAFLVQQNSKLRVFILNNEYLKDVAINKLYLVNFDYTLKSEEKSIVDVKLIKGAENEINLMVVLESGDIATYSLHMGSSKLNRSLLNNLIDDEFDFLSLGILSAAIFMLMTLKFARSIRININIRRQM